jgi:transposase-like protein
MAAIDVARLTEDEARAIFEKLRWPNGPKCIYCGERKKLHRINPKSKNTRDGLIHCYRCGKQFTVTVGTIMEDSHITLRQWIQAFFAMCSSKKGVSALQLQRNLGLGSYHSAWHLAHRIRWAMAQNSFSKLSGIVEADETYIGGKPRKGARDKDGNLIINKRGRGTRKTPVMALIPRGKGNMIATILDRVTAKNLQAQIYRNVAHDSTVMTDELPLYNSINRYYKHKTVNHSKGEYSRNGINCNTNESYFALLKRGVHGTFHHVSKTHLQRYCDEFSFRWNNRKVTDGKRTANAIHGAWGKRLSYKPMKTK